MGTVRAVRAACAAAIVVGTSLPACGVCSAIGDCPDQISVFATVDVNQAELVDAQAILCRNAACATGDLTLIGSNSAVDPIGMLTAASFTIEVYASEQSTGSTTVAFVYFSKGTVGGDTDYRDGDAFHASIEGSDGVSLLDVTRSAD